MNTTAIKDCRKAHKITQTKLAKISGVPQTTISGWEQGIQENHPIIKAIRIAKALNKDVGDMEDLFGAATPEERRESGV